MADLFVQIGLIAQQMGHPTLVTLSYDGTRLRASNRNTGTRTPDERRKAKQQLAGEFALHREAIEKTQASEEEAFDAAAAAESKQRGEQRQRQSHRIEAALAEIAKIEASGKKTPARLPITGPECRIAPDKEGGFADNFPPTVTIDVDRGLIIACDVISGMDEQSHMHEAIGEECPLRAKCFQDSRNNYDRQIESDPNEAAQQPHAAKMQEEDSREKYSRRAAVSQRPFAVIKQVFSAREFLVRGLEKEREEWRLLCIAHNLCRLFSLIDQQRARESIS